MNKRILFAAGPGRALLFAAGPGRAIVRLPHLLSFLLWLAPAATLAAPPGQKHDGDSDLESSSRPVPAEQLLSDTEVERIERVERFEVLVEPIKENPTAQNLFEACRGLSEEFTKLQITN